MIAPDKIDTTSLLTILGVIAAVWALITPNTRLRLRFCLAWWDWVIVGLSFFLSNYLVFSPVLNSLGIYYSLGPWKWGLDSSSAVYLILLSVAIYLVVRLKNPKLSAGRTSIFLELVENLHLTKRYDDLALLLAPQVDKLLLIMDKPSENKFIYKIACKLRITSRKTASENAREALLNIVSSPELIHHFALTQPFLCLSLMKIEKKIHSDFTSEFIRALLSSPNSRLYIELKNNLNTISGHRLAIPEHNKLLHYFFSSAQFASELQIYSDIGEVIFWRLDEDEKLISTLNKPLGSYSEVSKYRCPVYSAVTLFEIMIHEGIHQGLQDHLWLHYYKHFASKILKNMNNQTGVLSGEWETPFHYLLCHMFSIAIDWAEQSAWIDENEISQEIKNSDHFNVHYISIEATKLLGDMLQLVVLSKKLYVKTRMDILGMVVSCYIRLKRDKKLNDITYSLLLYTTQGILNSASLPYREALLGAFKALDDPKLRMDASEFRVAIENSIKLLRQ